MPIRQRLWHTRTYYTSELLVRREGKAVPTLSTLSQRSPDHLRCDSPVIHQATQQTRGIRPMLFQRRWPNIETALGECLVFAGKSVTKNSVVLVVGIHWSRPGVLNRSSDESHIYIIGLENSSKQRALCQCCVNVFAAWKRCWSPANTGYFPNAVSMLDQRRRRWANIEATLGECDVFVFDDESI